MEQPEHLKRIKRALELRGYEIKKEYAPDKNNQAESFYYSEIINLISKEAKIRYSYMTDFEVKTLPDKKAFIENCYKNSGALLTASKYENINPEYRKIFALFENGNFFINEDYASNKPAFDRGKIRAFTEAHRDYVYLRPIYVPKDYLEAIYRKAREFEWYIPAEDINTEKPLVDAQKTSEMNKYIEHLFNEKTCLTAVNPEYNGLAMKPDEDRYALFSDGTLIISEKHNVLEKILLQQLRAVFPTIDIAVQYVPDEYIAAIYEQLPQYQKGAKNIYIEMLKQKARKLKKMRILHIMRR